MKKCAIITIHATHNFGAMLQAYALQTTLIDLGHSAQIIDYGAPQCPPKILNRKPGLKSIPHALLCIVQRAYRWRRYERFVGFRDAFLKHTAAFGSQAELAANPPLHEILICGSDQIWNCTNQPFNSTFFLKFGRPNALRIAYAPSFGVASVPQECHSRLRDLLQGIDFLSCREESGTDLLGQLTEKPVAHVVDPTMLVSDEHWRSIAVAPAGAPPRYLLVYALEASPALREAVIKISTALDLPVVCIQTGVRKPNFPCEITVRDAGPLEFLGYMANADFVISNSFHGSVFSLLFRKQFFAPPHGHLNERMSNLFKLTGISFCQDLRETIGQLPNHIDYGQVGPQISAAIASSLEYLKASVDAAADASSTEEEAEVLPDTEIS